MNRLTPCGAAEPVSRDKILRRERGQGNIDFPCSADHESDWQPYPVDPYSATWDDGTYIVAGRLFLKMIIVEGVIVPHLDLLCVIKQHSFF